MARENRFPMQLLLLGVFQSPGITHFFQGELLILENFSRDSMMNCRHDMILALTC